MSIRCCASCDWIANNRTWHKDYCPNCEDTNWSDPLEDDRDWNAMYKEQKAEMFKEPERLKCQKNKNS